MSTDLQRYISNLMAYNVLQTLISYTGAESIFIEESKSMQEKVRKLEKYTKGLPEFIVEHGRSVGRYVHMIAVELLKEEENTLYGKLPMADKAYLIGKYHDIGKAGISNELWESPSRFTDAEYKLAQAHTVIGAHFIKPKLMLTDLSDGSDFESILAGSCLFHHERWDGEGYPFRLSGEQIPLYARIVAVADAYDAMIEKRPYKDSLPVESALEELNRQKGKQFDPVIVDVFCKALVKNDKI